MRLIGCFVVVLCHSAQEVTAQCTHAYCSDQGGLIQFKKTSCSSGINDCKYAFANELILRQHILVRPKRRNP